MDALHQLEIIWIHVLQSLGVWLVEPMRLFSMLGYEEFFLLVIPTIYWCFDSVFGIRLGIMLLLSQGTNHIFKLAFHTTRPYWISKEVQAFSTETSFGMPSGHAESAAGMWGLFAVTMRSTWVKVASIVVIFLIGFSRIYLGMHFISDVVAGWLIGGLLLWGFLKVEKPLTVWLKKRSLGELVGVAAASSVLILGAILLTGAATSGFQVPAEWAQYAAAAQPGNQIDPTNLSGAFKIAGTWFGLTLGIAWLYHRQGGYTTAGTSQQRLLRYLVGIAGLLIFWFVLGSVFPHSDTLVSNLLRFARYALIGLWVSALAPLLFERIGLSSGPQKQFGSLSSPENPL